MGRNYRRMKKIILLATLIFASCSSSSGEDVTIINPELTDIISAQASIEYLTDKVYEVSEGPVWSPQHQGLLFTDVAANKMYLWKEGQGVSVYLAPSGFTSYAPTFENGSNGANGVVYYGNQLILCQHGDRRVAYIEAIEGTKPTFGTLVDTYQGKRFNSPNDLVISRKGDFYFTDPPYGLYNKETNSYDEELYREIPFNGIFQYSAAGEVILISKELSRPNGIALSLDERYLYVNNSDPKMPLMMRYEVTNNWQEDVFFDGSKLAAKYDGNFDGMKVHSSGHIFTTGPNGILILSPTGELMGTINFGKAITNCAFDTTETYLYVTTFDRLARIKLKP